MSAPSRLSRFMDVPGGIDAGQALAAADENLSGHRDAALDLIDRAIGDLSASDNGQASTDAVTRLADSVASLAGMFELVALSQAAKRLSDTVRALAERQTWDQETVAVHIAALRILRTQTDEAVVGKILRGLDQLAAHATREKG
jgi:HPt (histidine-containing phosphotransfer) domain-containing protein